MTGSGILTMFREKKKGMFLKIAFFIYAPMRYSATKNEALEVNESQGQGTS